MNSELPREFVSAAPGAPDEEMLSSVSAQARARVGGGVRRTREGVRPAWRVAGGLLATAAVVAVVAFAMTPRVDDSAFARKDALAALMPKTGVLHTQSMLKWGQTGVDEQTVYAESWIDVEANQERSTERDGQSGDTGMSIRQGRLVRGLGRDGGLDQKTGKVIPGKWRVVQYEMPADALPGGGYTQVLVDGLETGRAKVTDRVTIDGEPYWVVGMTLGTPDDSLDDVITDYSEEVSATLREGDYYMRDLTIRRKGVHKHDGPFSEKVYLEYTKWETVTRESLPADFFDLSQVDAAAPKDAIIEVPLKK
ncbi:MAG TPA: hypothetical protein VFG89_10550 [Coriobacteriia bacterium]|nr:hypothetical protein [Coriobacteriia bacterium]